MPNCTLVFEVSSQYLKELIILKGPFTITHSGIFIQVVARWTAALEAAEGVDTVAPLAQPWQLLAFVNVCQEVRKLCLEATPEQSTWGTSMPSPGTSCFFKDTQELLDI